MIHPTAIIAPEARLGEGVEIGPCAIVEAGVETGPGCVVHAHAVVKRGTILGRGVIVHSHAVLGGAPQDLKFDEAVASGVRIGDATVVREGVTVNRSTKPGGFTEVGAGCFLMATSHVAHDCRIGDRVILANAVMLAGHVVVGEGTFLGGGCGMHQFGRVGAGAIVGGNASLSFDVPPFTMVAERNRLSGLNLVGLRRRGCPRETIAELKRLFARVYAASNPRREAAAALASGAASSAEGVLFLSFFGEGKRGIVRPRRSRGAAGDEGVDAE